MLCLDEKAQHRRFFVCKILLALTETYRTALLPCACICMLLRDLHPFFFPLYI